MTSLINRAIDAINAGPQQVPIPLDAETIGKIVAQLQDDITTTLDGHASLTATLIQYDTNTRNPLSPAPGENVSIKHDEIRRVWDSRFHRWVQVIYSVTDFTHQTDDRGQITWSPRWSTPGSHTYYAQFAGNARLAASQSNRVTVTVSPWGFTTVDRLPVEGSPSLALDANGYAHISYFDYVNADLKYAYQDDGGWHNMTVVHVGGVRLETSLALDANGAPHISYYDSTTRDLKYAYKPDENWSFDKVDSAADVGGNKALAFDANGAPHISYYDFTNQDLKYAYKDAGGWHNMTVDSDGQVGGNSSLALDANGTPHISYDDWTNQDLKYAYKDAGGWHNMTVDSDGHVGWWNSIALDANGTPHISYHGATTADLKYAYKDGEEWIKTNVDPPNTGGWYTSLALDANGAPHISYLNYTWGGKQGRWLMYAYKDALGWHITPVDSIIDVYYMGPSLALDANGYARISYHNCRWPTSSSAICGLRYAYRRSP